MIRQSLTDAVKEAMKARDQRATSTLRMVQAKLKDKDIEARGNGNPDGIDDSAVLSVLQGMIKQRRESIELYKQGNRPDLVDQETAEIAVIERFLPQQMDEAAVQAAVNEAIAAAGAKSIKDMGGVMAALKTKYVGQMDFAKASAVVKKTLSA